MQHWWMYGVEFFWQRMCPLGNCCEHGNEYSGFEMMGSLTSYRYIPIALIVSKAQPSHVSYILPTILGVFAKL